MRQNIEVTGTHAGPTPAPMKLLWESETRNDSSQHYILKRQTRSSRPFIPPHAHDYAELVYVERGTCTHVMDGAAATVGRGDVLFLVPDHDVHCYTGADRALSLLQILFQHESVAFLEDRYGQAVAGPLTGGIRNPVLKLTPMQQIWFERSFNALLVNPGSLIGIERFLLNFVAIVAKADRRGISGTTQASSVSVPGLQSISDGFRKTARR